MGWKSLGRFSIILIAATSVFLGVDGSTVKASGRASPSDAQIRQLIIDESIADYRSRTGGTCPCPYNLARNGSSCGRRSAYSRAGGERPLCYDRDISDEMVEEYRKAH
jgi:hypothetical protein